MKSIPLHGKNGKGKFVSVDDEDFDKLNKYHWYISNSGYAFRREKIILMHREIMNTPDDKVVDHVDHNRLNNIKSNLRNCSWSENSANNYKPITNNSGHKGVYKDKRGKFRAQIRCNDIRLWLGTFNTLEEASDAYNKKARELRGYYHRED